GGGAAGGPDAPAADSHDVGGDDHGRGAGSLGCRRRLRVAEATGLRHRRRRLLLHGAHAVRRAGGVPGLAVGVPLDRELARAALSLGRASPATRHGGGRLMLALLLAPKGGVSPAPAPT